MLESMRKHMNWMMWLIVGLITVTFLFFGIYPSDVGGQTVAKVGDYVIASDEFNRVYRNMYENYKQLLKDQFNDAMAKNLKSQALQELIANRLLLQEAEKVGLHVSDKELQAAIMKMPAFSREGAFDRKQYERLLDRYNMTPAMFEASQREFLLRQKIEQLVKDGVGVTETELVVAYKKQNPKAKTGDYEKNKESFRQMYLSGKQRDALNAFVRGIYGRTQITINEKALNS
jgi:peptidyl-prolyl cis-trans isomerase D